MNSNQEPRSLAQAAEDNLSYGNVTCAGLSFVASEDGKQLLAVSGTHCASGPIDTDQIKQMLVSQGFADLFIIADALEKVVKHYNSGTECTLVIGERRNGDFSISIASDLMSAQLTITPAYGGKPVTHEQIYAALHEKGITFGICDETVRSAVDKGYARNKVIAQGIEPAPGEDAQFISLLREAKNSRHHCDDNEVIDYRSFGDIITVKQGDPLMRRLPPTDGKPGTDILGNPVASPRGNDLQFSPLADGVGFHKDDPDLLVAAISGQPFLLQNGVTIEPVVTIKDVDLSTGNLDIEGSLTITGDVKPGMHVKATADIVIEGMVEAGHIEAGGDVEIRGAVIGHGEPRISVDELNPSAAVIHAEGSVKALFVENAVISSGADIVIREFVMKSELSAGTRILVGEQGSGKGRIISSKCRAAAKIEATIIGSRSGAGTVLEVGVDPIIHDKFTTTKQLLHARERELEEASKALHYYRNNPARTAPDTLREREKTLPRLQTEIQELSGQLRRLKKRFDQLDSASIKAEHQVFCGVKISIGEKTLLLENDMEGTTFTMGENGINFS